MHGRTLLVIDDNVDIEINEGDLNLRRFGKKLPKMFGSVRDER